MMIANSRISRPLHTTVQLRGHRNWCRRWRHRNRGSVLAECAWEPAQRRRCSKQTPSSVERAPDFRPHTAGRRGSNPFAPPSGCTPTPRARSPTGPETKRRECSGDAACGQSSGKVGSGTSSECRRALERCEAAHSCSAAQPTPGEQHDLLRPAAATAKRLRRPVLLSLGVDIVRRPRKRHQRSAQESTSSPASSTTVETASRRRLQTSMRAIRSARGVQPSLRGSARQRVVRPQLQPLVHPARLAQAAGR